MLKLLALVPLLAASTALANPMLEKCLPVAPKSCALEEKSDQDAFLKCFEKVELKPSVPAEQACGEELLHAKVHRDCATDIPKVCAGVKPGANRTMDCLRAGREELTPACRKSL